MVALGSMVGLVRYVGGAEDRATASAELVPILTAAADLPEGTSFANAFGSGQVVWSETPASVRPSTAVVDPNALAGMVAKSDIAQGQVIVIGEFVEPTAARRSGPPTFAAKLPDGTVAVSFDAVGCLGRVRSRHPRRPRQPARRSAERRPTSGFPIPADRPWSTCSKTC